ncbi:MAG: hypothetical protein NVS3B19_06140 [Ginsengibacter sp.]
MKSTFYLVVLISASFFYKANAQNQPVFPKGEIGKNINNYTGTIGLSELNQPDTNFKFSLAQAVYAPASKLDWHIHPGGQYLLITSGTGYYQEKGKEVQIVHKGDILKSLPGVAHWHGASLGSDFSYIAVTPVEKGKTIWLQRLTDAEYNRIQSPVVSNTNSEQEIIRLSEKKWVWMAEKNVDSLNRLFDAQSMFVHMGGSWEKEPGLKTIKSGGIWYKKAEVYSTSVKIFGNTAILLSDIDLLAEVGGKEVVHSFMVTEVYIKSNYEWKIGSLTFSQLLRPVKMKTNIKE